MRADAWLREANFTAIITAAPPSELTKLLPSEISMTLSNRSKKTEFEDIN